MQVLETAPSIPNVGFKMQLSKESFQKHSSPALGINYFTGWSKLSWKRIWANSQHPHPKQKGSHNTEVVGGRSSKRSENSRKASGTKRLGRGSSWGHEIGVFSFPSKGSCPVLAAQHSSGPMAPNPNLAPGFWEELILVLGQIAMDSHLKVTAGASLGEWLRFIPFGCSFPNEIQGKGHFTPILLPAEAQL